MSRLALVCWRVYRYDESPGQSAYTFRTSDVEIKFLEILTILISAGWTAQR